MSVVPNLEEAGAIAAEYIATLDNLPNEVQFILAEIKHKETKCEELNREIHKETSKYLKQSVRATASSSSAPSPSPQTPNPAAPSSTSLSAKVIASYALLEQLTSEKVALAQRMTDLVARAKARLDHDLARVLVAQGDVDPASASLTAAAAGSTSGFSWATPGPAASSTGAGAGRSAVKEVNDRLTATITLPEVPNLSAAATTPVPKRRRLNPQPSTTSIKLPSPSPSIITLTPTPAPSGVRSRLQNQIHMASRGRRSAQTAIKLEQKEEEEEDAEGDEDVEEEAEGGVEGPEVEEEPEDKTIYCFCQQTSFGEMVGCDSDKCKFQWFHLGCVNLKPPLPETWYCDYCVNKGYAPAGYHGPDGTQPTRKRGRK
ncbi:hypothetical protein OE88DRAFT_611522 [Heliocybe sulcata]|uniref:Chromatin modification-related protein n=1 Tax=Heliocybe sulcata TaxID=5364 RepID=A0A5C3NP06_9AGAM|nr:hypothetical protein OE88DRAFT_611522 [Heliocybe sulcata]